MTRTNQPAPFFSLSLRSPPFSTLYRPVYEIATSDGFLREGFAFREGQAYAGGNAKLIERCFSITGPEMLYVGDHLFTDVNMAKRGLSWRTCLILQELEEEMAGLSQGASDAQRLTRLLRKKDLQASYVNHLRTRLLHHEMCGMPAKPIKIVTQQEVATPAGVTMPPSPDGSISSSSNGVDRNGAGGGAVANGQATTYEEYMANRNGQGVGEAIAAQPTAAGAATDDKLARLREGIAALEAEVRESEQQIEQMVAMEGNHVNEYWGYMSRAGFADKSHLMRQIEKYADIYTSRVCNLLPYTPYKQFLCQRQSLAHSTTSYSGRPLMEHWQIISDVSEEEESIEASIQEELSLREWSATNE